MIYSVGLSSPSTFGTIALLKERTPPLQGGDRLVFFPSRVSDWLLASDQRGGWGRQDTESPYGDFLRGLAKIHLFEILARVARVSPPWGGVEVGDWFQKSDWLVL